MKLHKTTFVAGLGIGYVLGAHAGRERYEAIRKAAGKVADAPVVRQTANVVQVQAYQVTRTTVAKGKEVAGHAVEAVRNR